jgi:hypothetical protein
MQVHCEQCGEAIYVPQYETGKKRRCPGCGTKYRTPVLEPEDTLAQRADATAAGSSGTVGAGDDLLRGKYWQDVARTRAAGRESAPVEPRASLGAGALGATIGAAIGATLWALTVRFFGVETGLLAVGVGAITGVMARSVGKAPSASIGLAAAAIAAIGIAAGSYAGFRMSLYTEEAEKELRLIYEDGMRTLRDEQAAQAADGEAPTVDPEAVLPYEQFARQVRDDITFVDYAEYWFESIHDGVLAVLFLFLGVSTAWKFGAGRGDSGAGPERGAPAQ